MSFIWPTMLLSVVLVPLGIFGIWIGVRDAATGSTIPGVAQALGGLPRSIIICLLRGAHITQFFNFSDLTWPEVAALPRYLPLVLPLGAGYPLDAAALALGSPPLVGWLPARASAVICCSTNRRGRLRWAARSPAAM